MSKVSRRYAAMLAAPFFVLLALSACGGGGASGGAGAGAEAGDAAGGAVATGEADLPESAAPGEESAASGSGVLGDEAGDGGFDRKIVKTAELGIRAEEVRDVAARAQRVADRFGGSVLSSEVRGGDGSVSAQLLLLVPSPEFEGALDELRGLGKKVTTDTVKGQDVTEEFVDLKSRERNLLAAEASLLKLYDRAESVEDTLTVQRELTNVRGEIERVQGRIKYLEQRTEMSRISLTVEPVASKGPPPGWDPSAVAARAWEASLALLQALATAAISAVVFAWWLVPALLVAGLWRRGRRSGPAATDSS